MGVRKDERNTNFNSKHFKEEEGHGSGGFFAKYYEVFRKYLGIFHEKTNKQTKQTFALKNTGMIWKTGHFHRLYFLPLVLHTFVLMIRSFSNPFLYQSSVSKVLTRNFVIPKAHVSQKMPKFTAL